MNDSQIQNCINIFLKDENPDFFPYFENETDLYEELPVEENYPYE